MRKKGLVGENREQGDGDGQRFMQVAVYVEKMKVMWWCNVDCSTEWHVHKVVFNIFPVEGVVGNVKGPGNCVPTQDPMKFGGLEGT
jgi:hypothetical protein